MGAAARGARPRDLAVWSGVSALAGRASDRPAGCRIAGVTSPPARPSWLLRQAAFAVYVVGITGGVALAGGWWMLGMLRTHLDRELDIEGGWFLVEDPEFGLRMGDDVAIHFRDPSRGLELDVATDARGLRVRRAGERVETPIDVLFVGGSFTFGWGVEAEESIPERFAAASGLRVANAATPAVGTQSAAYAVRRLADLAPRYVVYGLIDDHLRRNTCPCATTPTPFCQQVPYVREGASAELVEEAPIDSFFAPNGGMEQAYRASHGELGFWRAQYWVFRAALGFFYRRAALGCSGSSEVRLAALDLSLDRLAAESRAAGAKLVVAYMPQMGGIRSLTFPPLGKLAKRRDMVLIDLSVAISEHLRGRESRTWEQMLLPNDVHPSAEAHEVFARALCTRFEEMGAVPTGRCPPALAAEDASSPAEPRAPEPSSAPDGA